jgi:hypothetical protein
MAGANNKVEACAPDSVCLPAADQRTPVPAATDRGERQGFVMHLPPGYCDRTAWKCADVFVERLENLTRQYLMYYFHWRFFFYKDFHWSFTPSGRGASLDRFEPSISRSDCCCLGSQNAPQLHYRLVLPRRNARFPAPNVTAVKFL